MTRLSSFGNVHRSRSAISVRASRCGVDDAISEGLQKLGRAPGARAAA